MYAIMWFATMYDGLAALPALNGSPLLQPLGPGPVQALAGLQLASGWDAYYFGLIFYALGTAVFSCLWFRSSYVFRAFALWGLASALFEGFCAFAYVTFPAYGKLVSVNWYEMPALLFELPLSIWLLYIGLRSPKPALSADPVLSR